PVGRRADRSNLKLTLLHERADAQAATLQACQQPLVGGVVADEHARLTERRAGRQEAGGCVELALGLPEVRDVSAPCGKLAPAPEGSVPTPLLPTVKSAGSKQSENPTLLRREILARGGLQLTKGGHHEPCLRYIGLATRAALAMGLEPVPILRRQPSFQV